MSDGMLDYANLTCPYCGDPFETTVDSSAGAQDYIEDCPVCCRPIEISVLLDENGGIHEVRTRTDEE